MKRILYLTLTIMLCLTFFTAVTWAGKIDLLLYG